MSTQTSAEMMTVPPQAVLYQIATGHYFSQAIYVAAKLGIGDLLADGPQHYETIATATQSHAPSLNRVLRLLATAGVLTEEENGHFALTGVGDCLRSDVPGSFRASALLFAGPLVWNSWGDLLHCVRTGKPAVEHVFGMDTFAYFEQHPEDGALFDEAMSSFTSLVALAVVAAYDFGAFKTVIDIGGGNGALLIGILQANPHLRGVVFDLARVAGGAQQRIAAAGLTERCAIASGDFFAAVPSGGDAYILKHVIHDWSDDRAMVILQNCRRAMAPQSKLLIVEGVYPPRVDQSPPSRGAAANDVNMLVCTGGRQRSEAEFRALYDAAGFELTRIVPTVAMSSVVEGVPRR